MAERIRSAAIRDRQGRVVTAQTHPLALAAYEDRYGEMPERYESLFQTTTGRLVDQAEAARVADLAGDPLNRRDDGGGEELLTNVVLSHNPCPDCQECNGKTMTLREWEESQWGLPTSSGRVCEDDCHCILAPAGKLKDYPAIGDAMLRGEKGSDIRGIVEIGPNEQSLKSLMEEWYKRGNDILPREIYSMDYDDIAPYLRRLMGKK